MNARDSTTGTNRHCWPWLTAECLVAISIVSIILLLGPAFSRARAESLRSSGDPEVPSLEILFAESETSTGVLVPPGFIVVLQAGEAEICRLDVSTDAQALSDQFQQECSERPVEGESVTAILVSDVGVVGSVAGLVSVEGEVTRILFPPLPQGAILIAELTFPESGRAPEDLDGPATVTYPPDCGDGVVEDGVLVLYYDTARPDCTGIEAVTIGFRAPNGPEYRIAVPSASVADGSIDLDSSQEANGRGGAVTIQTEGGTEPWPVQRGLRLSFSSNGQVCGTSDINENGAYAVSLSEPCTDESNAEVTMLDTELVTSLNLGSAPKLTVAFKSGDGQRLAMGRAQADEAALPEGETFTVESTELVCGSAQVQRDGAYILLLPEACITGGSLTATSSSGLMSSFSMPEDGSPTVNLVFTDQDELVAEAAGETAAPQRVDPLLKSWQVIVIMSTILFITVVALFVKWDSNNRNRGVEKLMDAAAQNPGDYSIEEIRKLAEVHRSPSFAGAYDLALLAFVTVALVTLTLGGTVTEQGVLTILGAIVGYAAGRGGSSRA